MELGRRIAPLGLRRKFREGVRDWGGRVLDTVYPPEDIDVFALTLLDEPCCERCGTPFEFGLPGVECVICTARSPRYGRARAALAYDEASQGLILGFKHGGQTVNLDMFAAQMLRAGRKLLADADVLMPVPLHPSRLRQRRFNQSALLAGRIAKLSGVPMDADTLRRTRKTPSQGHKSAKGRRRNVQGAFATRGEAPAHCVLVDDVMTTGATLEACALALMRAGAKRVDCLTLARVVRAESPL